MTQAPIQWIKKLSPPIKKLSPPGRLKSAPYRARRPERLLGAPLRRPGGGGLRISVAARPRQGADESRWLSSPRRIRGRPRRQVGRRVRGRVRGAACYRSQGAGHRAAPTLPSVDICARALQRPRGWAELVLALCWPGQRAWQPDDRMWLHERLVRQSACPTVRLAVLPRGLLVPQPDCVSARLGLCVTRLPRCFREPVFLRTGSVLEIHTDETPVHSHSHSRYPNVHFKWGLRAQSYCQMPPADRTVRPTGAPSISGSMLLVHTSQGTPIPCSFTPQYFCTHSRHWSCAPVKQF